jgi:hypothetical protein
MGIHHKEEKNKHLTLNQKDETKMTKKLLFCMAMILALAIMAIAQNAAPVFKRTVAGNQQGAIYLPLDDEEDRIAYDGTPTQYITFTAVGTKFTVRFTPIQACTLSYVEICSYNGAGGALLHVWSDSGGIPGHDLRTPQSVTLLGTPTYQHINISPRLDIGAADFHVGIEYTRVPPPFMTSDNDGPTENRSKYKRPTDATWINLGDDFNIRSYVRYYGADQVPPTIESTWRVLGFTLEGDHPITANIVDASGVASAFLHYSTNGVDYDSVAMTNTSGAVWQGNVPNQPEGTIVRYFVTAYDNSANHNRGILPAGGSNAPFTMTIVKGRELAYEDGVADHYWIVDTGFADNAFAIRMTPTFYPAKVMMARAFTSGESSVNFTINGVSAGAPGTALPGGEEIDATPGPHNWAIANWVNGPVINSGSFFFVLHWMPTTPDDPSVGQDTNSVAMRSYWYSTTSNWNNVTDGDWIMRTVISTPVGIYDVGSDGTIPAKFELLGNYPNPFNPATEIRFLAPNAGDAKVEIYNVAGQLVKTVFNGRVEAGIRNVNWDGKDTNGNSVSSGIYFYRLSSAGQVDTDRMIMLK